MKSVQSITHPAWVAFGLATFSTISLTGPIISPNHDLIYHLAGAATPVIVTVVVYYFGLWLALLGLLLLARRRGRARAIVWSGLLLPLPPVLLHAFHVFTNTAIPHWLMPAVTWLAIAAFALSVFRWRQALGVIDRIRPAASVLFSFVAFFGVGIFAQLLWAGAQARHLNAAPVLHRWAANGRPAEGSSDPAPGQAAAPRHRVIWVLLDELSYQQVYERRFPGLALPAFDRLAAGATVFTDAVPTGDRTSYIVPTLMTGLPANAVDVSASGRLLALRDPASGRWNRFDPRDTVFQDALNAGYTTGIAGWYNPYCRILPEVLDRCVWTYREDTPANLAPRGTVVGDFFLPLRRLGRAAAHLFGQGRGVRNDEQRDLYQHIQDYTTLTDAADRFVADSSIRFLLLHLPVPHPYGFYDRRTGGFADHHTSYVDNLALADAYLGRLRAQLERQGEWDSTTLVVMGDHAWRTRSIWLHSAGWTAEDDAASHGGEFDPRPGVIVKLPGQLTAARVDTPWSAVRTRALLDALLREQVKTPAELQNWTKER